MSFSPALFEALQSNVRQRHLVLASIIFCLSIKTLWV